MEVDILKPNDSLLVSLTDVSPNVTLAHLKKLICKEKRNLYPERIALRLEPKSKMLSDDTKLNSLTLKQGKILYFKDLGPQIGWKTVFLWEYFGPLVCYLVTYLRPTIIYGKNATLPMHSVVTIAAICWSFHYLKRLYETVFVHRFSHATMPLTNLFKVDILKPNDSLLVSLTDVSPNVTLAHLKKLICKEKRNLYPERIALRLEPKSKMLSDDTKLNSLTLKQGKILYFKDLGPQIGWKTVFLWEYFGPLVCYLVTYLRPTIIYGKNATLPMHSVVTIAAICWSFHYLKRLYETVFVHRFSHATMPLTNLFKNCTYYWGFAFYIGYYVNHPLYTSPLLGNYSIHIALRDLRPAGTNERKIPVPTSNPFTILFNYVSCPNYTYEVGSCFTLMTQCVPVGAFMVAGFYQMAIWALGKHRNYKKEFEKYPRSRKAIVPFLI